MRRKDDGKADRVLPLEPVALPDDNTPEFPARLLVPGRRRRNAQPRRNSAGILLDDRNVGDVLNPGGLVHRVARRAADPVARAGLREDVPVFRCVHDDIRRERDARASGFDHNPGNPVVLRKNVAEPGAQEEIEHRQRSVGQRLFPEIADHFLQDPVSDPRLESDGVSVPVAGPNGLVLHEVVIPQAFDEFSVQARDVAAQVVHRGDARRGHLPADPARFLHKSDPGAHPGRLHRRGCASGSCAHHDYVVLVAFLRRDRRRSRKRQQQRQQERISVESSSVHRQAPLRGR